MIILLGVEKRFLDNLISLLRWIFVKRKSVNLVIVKSIQSLCQDVHTISHDVHVLYVLVILSLVLSIIAGIVLVLAFITS